MAKNNGVNYIKHLEQISELFYEDKRLSPWHVSLYYGLFHSWNRAKFQSPISICRSELMTVSKIGSANTYTKCLKQLDEWGYINYLPSHNPMKGSLVNLYTFDTTTDKSSDRTGDKSTDNTPVTLVRPSINNTNKKKQTKPIKQRRESDQLSKIEARTESSNSRMTKTKFSPPSIDEVKVFFLELKSTQDQAEQFHNHFESNGWLVGGKAKMKDWKAAVRNWIKRSANFSKTSSNQDRLNTNQDKDYSMPL